MAGFLQRTLNTPAGNEVERGAGEADRDDNAPHAGIAELGPRLETGSRSERQARPACRIRRAEVDAAEPRRGHVRDQRLGRRRPEHLAEHDDEEHDDDDPEGRTDLQRRVRRSHQHGKAAEVDFTATRAEGSSAEYRFQKEGA